MDGTGIPRSAVDNLVNLGQVGRNLVEGGGNRAWLFSARVMAQYRRQAWRLIGHFGPMEINQVKRVRPGLTVHELDQAFPELGQESAEMEYVFQDAARSVEYPSRSVN